MDLSGKHRLDQPPNMKDPCHRSVGTQPWDKALKRMVTGSLLTGPRGLLSLRKIIRVA